MIVRTDGNRVSDHIRMIEGPLQRLHPAERAAHHDRKACDAERTQRAILRLHHVFDGNERPARTVRFAVGRERRRTRRAVAAAEHVDADDAHLGWIEELAWTDDAGPPIAHVRASGERVRNQNGVAAVFAKLTLQRDELLDALESSAAREVERTDVNRTLDH